MEKKMEKNYLNHAKDMELFRMFEHSPGVIFWEPRGLKLYENLKRYIRAKHMKYGYQEVKSPAIVGLSLFKQSGHLDKFNENMFLVNQENKLNQELELNQYALKPMSCPSHIALFNSKPRNDKHMPMRYFEFGEVFRNEPSGSLQSLFRLRAFCQDDSHIFVSEEKMIGEISNYLKMANEVYHQMGFQDIEYHISLRPENKIGDEALWDKAEGYLKQACQEHNLAYHIIEGGGAFYGPKIELHIKDKLGRSWQLGVIQLDYVLPKQFNLKYIKNSESFEPVILHHAVLGSLERFIGILLDSYGKDLPDFLQSELVAILPIKEKHNDYAQKLYNKLDKSYNNVLIDMEEDSLSNRIKKYKSLGISNILVIGDKEIESNQFNLNNQIISYEEIENRLNLKKYYA